MNSTRSILAMVLLAAGLGWGILHLFGLQFAGGDVYPAYSTLRDDPAGAKVIFESLIRLPGVTAGRSYVPLDRLTRNAGTVFLLGIDPLFLTARMAADLRQLERFAGRGNRLVLAFQRMADDAPRSATLEELWGIRFGVESVEGEKGVLYFAAARNWNIVERKGEKVLIVERKFGEGSIVLVGDGEMFSNQSLADSPQPALLARIIGPHTHILFDEAHFGIMESGSVAGLMRRFRLHGLAIGLALWAALFLWKNASVFPPVESASAAESASGRTSAAGLVTLLRRHLPPEELAPVCWQEWLKGNRSKISAARRAQAEAVLHNNADRPSEAIRQIQVILHSKGAL